MIQLLFFLRFRTQLHRTREEFIDSLEQSIINTIKLSGGTVTTKQQVLIATFDEKNIGLWLTIVTVLDAIAGYLAAASAQLYGYSLVVGSDIPLYKGEKLCRSLAVYEGRSHIWCSSFVREALKCYVVFENTDGDYSQIEKIVLHTETVKTPDFREKIRRLLIRESRRNIILAGPAFIGKIDGVYHYSIRKQIPPLMLRFGPQKNGLCCFIDAFTAPVRALLSSNLEKLDQLAQLLSRQRLHTVFSEALIHRISVFFTLLLETYIAEVRRRNATPVFILENIQWADKASQHLVTTILSTLRSKAILQVYATYSSEAPEPPLVDKQLKSWEPLFSKIINFFSEERTVQTEPEITADLWEIAYTFFLFNCYFPGSAIPTLLAAEGTSSIMISTAFTLLCEQRIIDFIDDPIPRIHNFVARAEATLGARITRIHTLLCKQLLAQVAQKKLSPSFMLLKLLRTFNGAISSQLVLNVLYHEVINNNYTELDQAFADNSIESILGADMSLVVHSIYKTFKELIHGNETSIQKAFDQPEPNTLGSVGYSLPLFNNWASFYLGIRDTKSALRLLKAAIVNFQKEEYIAQSYRLFALVYTAKQRIEEAVDYINFAIESAKNNAQTYELTISLYYAAVIYFLQGNLSKAERLAIQSSEWALSNGQYEWVDRAKFLHGRVCFEIGFYDKASAIFENIRSNPHADIGKESLTAWFYRSSVLACGITPVHKSAQGIYDIRLFELEDYYIRGDYQRVLGYADKLLANLPEQRFMYTEKPDWWSGFTQCEFLLLDPPYLFSHFAKIYRSLAVCRLSSKEAHGQALTDMQHLINSTVLKGDPYTAFYYFAYYLILQQTGAKERELNTAISIAFRKLQSRASYIDDPKIRQSFLTLQYWNAPLNEAARKHKLI
ncbi:MAG: tetratricopeptide repeat protein [Spirochaetaceae bacterium]|jgi:tetratricopeptide (TPR) repeat protein|nr:tetratricopeptide repeat protein [Spirochaetaceae bacterium]